MGKLDPTQETAFVRSMIVKEQAFAAKSEANAKKAVSGKNNKEPHWMCHVESPTSVVKKGSTEAIMNTEVAEAKEVSRPASVAVSEQERSGKLGQWKVDFDDTGSHASVAARSNASHTSQAAKKSKAGTARTSDSEIVNRLAQLEVELKNEKLRRREAAEQEMKEMTKVIGSAPVIVSAKPTV